MSIVESTLTPSADRDPASGLSIEDIVPMLSARGAELEHLLERASALRDQGLADAGRPGVITYSRKVFVPLTTLCRDRCHYCVFVDTPAQLIRQHKPLFMSGEQVLAVAREGARTGCKEVLLTLGDRPEDRWPQAREWLDAAGYTSTLDYVAAMARLVTAETGLLAHVNPGVMSATELAALRPVAPSMGMMLETTSSALFTEPGGVHFGSPDKDPAVRLEVLENAGRARIPFTTGILVGIGETVHDRAESLIALRDLQARHGHLQEVIVQNFRAKPRTAMRDAADADRDEYLAAIATARIVLGPNARIQVPPNLSRADEGERLIAAGIDDWGGVSPVTADHVNPERPWPHLTDLAAMTSAAGFTLTERLTAHPEYIRDRAEWIDVGLHPAVMALADPASFLAAAPALARGARTVRAGIVGGLVERAAQDPASLDDAEWARLLTATGADLDAVAQTANDVRRYTVGEAISFVVNRNLTTTGLREHRDPGPETFTLDDVAQIAADAADLGVTEICVQGRIPRGLDARNYLGVIEQIRSAAPEMHVHAYRPQDVADFADRAGISVPEALEQLRSAGVNTVPGTGVKVLSERVRSLIAPDDLEIGRWVAGITAAHRAGLKSTSVMFYGHVETAGERIAHLRLLRAIQHETAGFTEFVPIPLPGANRPLVDGRDPRDEDRAMVAVARLMLSGSIANIQVPWPRVGTAAAADLLRAGGNDLGGALLNGRVLPETGVEHEQQLTVQEATRIADRLLRPFRVRATDYAEPRPQE